MIFKILYHYSWYKKKKTGYYNKKSISNIKNKKQCLNKRNNY